MKIKVGISNHHVHLSQEALEILFGKGYELTVKNELLQKGQFAANEQVSIGRNGKTLEHIRIVGPVRPYTQVELLEKDNEFFGINAPVRASGDLENSETVVLMGPNGMYVAKSCAIVANRHIHMSAEDLKTFNVNNKDVVIVKTKDGVLMDNVTIKSDDTCVLEYHMNKDEAADLGIENGDEVEIC